MKKLILFVWLLLPVAAAAYHYGPGQTRLHDDRAADALARGRAAAELAREVAAEYGDDEARAHWGQAEAAFGEALAELSSERIAEARVLRLERAKAWMFLSRLSEAREEFQRLVEELEDDPAADPALLSDVRSALANAQYYTTWLMRLEGVAREEWEREIESARQNFTLCAAEAGRSGDEERARAAEEDVESAIRLARMDLAELQGLPLPSQ